MATTAGNFAWNLFPSNNGLEGDTVHKTQATDPEAETSKERRTHFEDFGECAAIRGGGDTRVHSPVGVNSVLGNIYFYLCNI